MRRGYYRFWIGLLVAMLAAWLTHAALLEAVGGFLIKTDPLRKAGIAVVLAGDGYGRRIMKAVELVDEGWAPLILVDGPRVYYDRDEAQLAIEFARNRGASPEVLDPFPMDALSTMEEARLVDAELRRRGIDTALVVTSDFHTRRARSIFQKETSGEVEYAFVSAPHPHFSAGDWWRSREGRKVVVIESLKTLHSWFE